MSREKNGVLDWLSRRLNLTEIFSLLTSYGIYYGELDNRKPLREALAEVRDRPVPSYARWPRVLSLVAVVLIGLLIVSGGLLALYYLPTPESAHASLGTILRDVHFGEFMHQLHFWGSQLLLLVLGLRLIRYLSSRLYRSPRELIWVFGAMLILVALHADLTGRALPMTTRAYWSSVRALEIVGAVPIYGDLVQFFVGGSGATLSELTLIRFYVFHVAVLPLLAIMLIYLHFSTIRRVGLADDRKENLTPFQFSTQLLNLAIILAMVFGLLVTLAVLAPIPFERQADPYATVPGVGPPWYLLASFGFLEWASRWMPQWLAGLVLFSGFMGFLVWPFLDRGEGGARRRWTVVVIGSLLVIAWVIFTIYGSRMA